MSNGSGSAEADVKNVFQNRVLRPVRVYTASASFDGLLTVSLGMRTQDELNIAARPFLTLASGSVYSGRSALAEGTLSISKAAILFAFELPDLGSPLAATTDGPALGRFARAVLRLQVGDFAIEGYAHAAQGGDALSRLNQVRQPFMALSPASLEGAGVKGAMPFVAINRQHVIAAQEILSIHALPEDPSQGADPQVA